MPGEPNERLYKEPENPPTQVTDCAFGYAELDVTTNFSFLRGASHPEEMVHQSANLGYRALAITDRNSLAGVVRAFGAAQKVAGLQLIVGARLAFADGTPDVLVWPTDREAYSRLARLLTTGKLRAEKGGCDLRLEDLLQYEKGMMGALVYSPEQWPSDGTGVTPTRRGAPRETHLRTGGTPVPPGTHRDAPAPAALAKLLLLREAMGRRLSLAASAGYGGEDERHLREAAEVSRRTGVPLLATNHVHYHDPGRKMLQDVLTCVRHGCTIREAGHRLFPNAERHLKAPELMHRLFAAHPAAIRRGMEVAEACKFTLKDLQYEYPLEAVPPGVSPSAYLRELTYAGAREKYSGEIPGKVVEALEKELKFICGSKYESYFLTVYDLVREARELDILCQGRGSAANSAVCYCLGVTAVDPNEFQLVFERFASEARDEPPDIDIDFEHEKREKVIQYVYEKYGREHAGMTATVISYRGRSAVRDVGKALGLSGDVLDQLAEKLDWWHGGRLSDPQLREAGVDPEDPAMVHLVFLTTQLLGFPRHLSQHVGGMVISRSPLCELVPIENATMDDRYVIEWDKDDLDAVKLFKVDILGLGMLTMIGRAFGLIAEYDRRFELHTIPKEHPAVYEMASGADTVGVFQIESRAQMAMLPRLRPTEYYDLVIEVAIVRPGPIQGGMVQPYLKAREMLRADPNYRVRYPKPELEAVLAKTLGVPLFQEQAMKMAVVAAGFTGAEADALRRSMASWNRSKGLGQFGEKFINGMLDNGYEFEFAKRCFDQISGFGEYGFPESHAASFAKLVYASAWIKRFHPAAFLAAILNSLPMGFYGPAQLVRDAQEHGVEVRPVDVNASEWDCTLEYDTGRQAAREKAHKSTWGKGGPGVRLGLRMVKGLSKEAGGERITSARKRRGRFNSVVDLQRVAGLEKEDVDRLARADAFSSLSLSRRGASWDALALSEVPAPLAEEGEATAPLPVTPRMLPPMSLFDEVATDYSRTGLSLKRHPVSFAREVLAGLGIATAEELGNPEKFPNGRRARVAGLVLVRQRPGNAKAIFFTLEDETGIANLIVWGPIYETYRKAARHAVLLEADGIVQREGKVMHVICRRLVDHSELVEGLVQPSRNFR